MGDTPLFRAQARGYADLSEGRSRRRERRDFPMLSIDVATIQGRGMEGFEVRRGNEAVG